jgi:putative ABC transport system permease protein
MTLFQLAWKNLTGSAFRSGAVFLCAALVAGLTLISTVLVSGASGNLESNLGRMGADLIILPWGTQLNQVEDIHLMSLVTQRWMPRALLDRVAAVEGVTAASPQRFLLSMAASPYCECDELYVVAIDPGTDFTLAPWLPVSRLPGSQVFDLEEGKAVGGSQVNPRVGSAGAASTLNIHGLELTLTDQLVPTGTSIDQTLFVSFGTAQALGEKLAQQGQTDQDFGPEKISAIMVRVDLENDPQDISTRIMDSIPGVIPLENANLFQTERNQAIGLIQALWAVVLMTWVMAVVFTGLAFSIAVNERRRQIGVLRALGAEWPSIIRSILMEALTLAAAGGVAGILLAAFGLLYLPDWVAAITNLPFQAPAVSEIAWRSLLGLLLTLGSVTLGALVPSLRLRRREPALTMRE